MKCGCRIEWVFDGRTPLKEVRKSALAGWGWRIIYCALHDAAPEMAKALKKADKSLSRLLSGREPRDADHYILASVRVALFEAGLAKAVPFSEKDKRDWGLLPKENAAKSAQKRKGRKR